MSTSVRSRVSYETLRWARLSSGFELAEVARSASVSLERYQQWEAGDELPTFNQLRQVANKLKRPLAVFYMKHPPVDDVLPVDFRTATTADRLSYAPELRLELRKALRLQRLLSGLLTELNLGQHSTVPSANVKEDSEEVGNRLRDYLDFSVEQQLSVADPAALYRDLRDVAFEKGIVPIQFGVDRDIALGFALGSEPIPVVAVNTRQVSEAKTFTLLHEIAHVLLRMPGVSDATIPFASTVGSQKSEVEGFCNRVAAACLLPRDAVQVQTALQILRRPSGLDLNIVRQQARRFGVSKYALAYRLSAISPEFAPRVQSAVSHWFAIDSSSSKTKSESKGGPPPALITLGKRGRAFSRAVLAGVRDSRLTPDDARDLLDLEPHHFPKLEEFVFKTGAEEAE